LAIKPLAGELAGTLFAIGILNAGFMGIVIVSLSTAYAFSEFFGLSSGLNTSFRQSKTFYIIFIVQLIIASVAILLPGVNLFDLAVAMQTINAMVLPLVFFYLISLTSNRNLMGKHANNKFQKYFAIVLTVVIVIASFFTVYATFFNV
jgi:Mn2+/Fe2+ NRAMP family transporter